MVERKPERESSGQNRILFLVDDPELLQQQLDNIPLNVDLDFLLSKLADNVSTDAGFQKQYAFTDRENWGECALTGFPGIGERDILNGGFNILVAGENFFCGSAREQAVLTLSFSGIELIIAKSLDATFSRNCANNGILYTDDLSLIPRIQAGEPIPRKEILTQLPPLHAEIIRHGGLIPYALAQPETSFPSQKPQPLTMVEKIIARNLKKQCDQDFYPQTGDRVILEPDILVSYDLYTKWVFQLLEKYNLTPQAIDKLRLFSDHAVQAPFPGAPDLLRAHAEIAKEYGVKMYPFELCADRENVSSGVCHTLLRELELSPGDILLMTDSHTPTAGAIPALGIQTSITGITTAITGIATALVSGKHEIVVPQTIRIQLEGRAQENITPKDVILYLINQYHQIFAGKCIEFAGSGLEDWWPDESAVLTNMAKEGRAATAVIEPTKKIVEYMAKLTNTPYEIMQAQIEALKSDPGANFQETLNIDLNTIPVMVAKPGSPLNAVPLTSLENRPKIDTAYIGSCTGGTWLDILQAADVLKDQKVAKNVKLYIQPSSIAIYQAMCEAGLDKIFLQAGAIILPPACGACAGLGIGGPEKGQVGVSTSNRNFPGRMGKGDVWLASSLVTAASAIAGKLCHPSES